eukprot:3778761-Rhodomonas_salina.2
MRSSVLMSDILLLGCEQLLAELPSGRFAERLSSAGIQLQAPILESTGSSADSGQDVVEVRPLNGILNYHPPPSFTSSDPTGAGAVASSLQVRNQMLETVFLAQLVCEIHISFVDVPATLIVVSDSLLRRCVRQERVLKLFDSFVRVVPGVDGGPGQ